MMSRHSAALFAMCALTSAAASLAVAAAYDRLAPMPRLERAHVADLDQQVATLGSNVAALSVSMARLHSELDELRQSQEDRLPALPPPIHRTDFELCEGCYRAYMQVVETLPNGRIVLDDWHDLTPTLPAAAPRHEAPGAAVLLPCASATLGRGWRLYPHSPDAEPSPRWARPARFRNEPANERQSDPGQGR